MAQLTDQELAALEQRLLSPALNDSSASAEAQQLLIEVLLAILKELRALPHA